MKYTVKFNVVGCEGYRFTQPLLDDQRRVRVFDSEEAARAAIEESADAWAVEKNWQPWRKAAYKSHATVELMRC